MKKILLVILVAVLLIQCKAASNSEFEKMNYAVSLIPVGLRKDAKAVTRIKSTRFEVKDNKYAIRKVLHAVTIFNKDKRDEGVLVLNYDKFHEIEELEGRIYNVNGEQIRDLEDEDIKDYSDFTSFSLYDDSRVRIAEMYHDQFPYTVEYYYEISYNGYLGWPSWYAQPSLDPVQKSNFEVLITQDKNLRYWCNSDSIKPRITKEGDKTLYSWKANNLPELSRDVVGDDIEDITTIVYIAPDEFEIEDRPGNMTSWKSFGSWIYDLYKGKDILPEYAKQEIKSLITPIDGTIKKIKTLYRYMQSKTRYVSIQLGLGGWQPFDAAFVHEKGYGDCKALSNYMTSILREAGIEAYNVLIRSGCYRYPMITEFPSNQFNHVIVCVPVDKDTVWLECTSQTIPFNHIGRDNENRSALLISNDGGTVINTPETSYKDNKQYRKAFVEIALNGNADVKASVTWNGNQQDRVRNSIEDKSPEEIEKWIINSLDVPNLNLKNHTINGMDTPENGITLATNVLIQHYGSVTGKRLFFHPNIMEKRTYVPPIIDERLSPISFYYPYYDVDTVVYSIPKDFEIEMLPPETHIMSSFGEFFSKSELNNDGKIVFTRSSTINKYSIPSNVYSEYRKFFSDIVKADKMQVVLIKKM